MSLTTSKDHKALCHKNFIRDGKRHYISFVTFFTTIIVIIAEFNSLTVPNFQYNIQCLAMELHSLWNDSKCVEKNSHVLMEISRIDFYYKFFCNSPSFTLTNTYSHTNIYTHTHTHTHTHTPKYR